MAPSSEAVRLARRLRGLRESHESGLTQAALARALSDDKRVAVATISSWESLTNPKLPPTERLRSYALFFSTEKSTEGAAHLLAERELSPDERDRFHALYEELVDLRDAIRTHGAVDAPAAGGSFTWDFDEGPITIICPEAPDAERSPLADERNPNYTRMSRFADLDALVELWGHVRASNPELQIRAILSSEVIADRLTDHLVLIGGIGWNPVTKRLWKTLKGLPISQFEVPDLPTGEIFKVVIENDEAEFRPQMETADDGTTELVEDVGLLARLTNPFNHSRTITICNGVHSRGVVGAVRSLTDIAVRERNEAFLASSFPAGRFALLVRVPVVNGEAISPDLEIADNRLFEWSPDETVAIR